MHKSEMNHTMQRFFNYTLLDDINLVSRHLTVANDTTDTVIVVGCLNPHSFVTALDDKSFHETLVRCDYLLPDGEGICMSLKRWKGIAIDKIAGDDIHRFLLDRLSEQGGKVFYLGSSEHVLGLISERIGREYPSLAVETHSPSYCDELSEEESGMIIEKINSFSPDILFVSMTAPKQEKWVEKHRSKLKGVKIVASIGAVFDFYAGTVKRAPAWIVKLRLEWLVRFLKEPRRMWRRNFVSTPRYLRWVKENRERMIDS